MPERKTIIILVIACVLISLVLASSSLPYFVEPVTPIVPTPTYQLGIYYYCWMGYDQASGKWTGGQGSSHWAKADGITQTSTLGYYSSMDDRVLTWQLSEMKQLGISFLVVSWWGQTSFVNEAVLHLFQFVDQNNEPFQLAIMIEPYGSVNYANDMNYIWQLYNEYSDHIFEIGGKPLLAFFNPLLPPSDSRFSIRVVGQQTNVDWVYWQGMGALDGYGGTWGMNEVSQYMGNPKVSTDGVVAIIPKYDDYAMYLAGSRPHYMRFGLDGTLWQKELTYAKVNAKTIIICTWNEYSENTAIEPLIGSLST